MRLHFSLLLACFAVSSISFAQTTPPSADDVFKDACKEAKAQHKNVFILFHASWCGWCHKMDTAMADASCKPFFESNYVIRHLDLMEEPVKKSLENPGAMEMLTKYNGAKSGIPFWIILDKDGNLLADSKIRKPGEGPADGENLGCPGQENEAAYFVTVLKKTSTLKDDQLQIIHDRFRKTNPN